MRKVIQLIFLTVQTSFLPLRGTQGIGYGECTDVFIQRR